MTLVENPVASLRSLLDARYSCRAYRDDPVPVDVVREILEVAQRTPSWCNTQPWHVTVTSGEETERFRAHLSAQVLESRGVHDIEPPARYEGAYRERRRASGFALYNSLGIAYDDKEGRTRQMLENYRFFGAPHVAIITSEARLGPYGYVDCGAYVSNFLLAAASLGVATIAQASVAMYSNVVREHLSIPDTRHIVCAISFGYADDKHPANQFRTERASLDEATDLRGF
jgi:nitroreductase